MVPYLGCMVDGTTARGSFVMASVVRKLVCSLTLACKRGTFFILFWRRARRIRLLSLCRLATYVTELIAVPFSVMSSRITRVSRLRLTGRCMAHRESWGFANPDNLTFHQQSNCVSIDSRKSGNVFQTPVNISHWFLLGR
jgi:hypothetical protein